MSEEHSERLMAVALTTGVAISAVLVLAGFVLSFIVGWSGTATGAVLPPSQTTDFSGLIQRFAALQPLAIVQAGLIVLVATPVVRVAVTTLGFWRQRDMLYVGLSLLVLALLALSFGLLR